jgi:hypothetical protein
MDDEVEAKTKENVGEGRKEGVVNLNFDLRRQSKRDSLISRQVGVFKFTAH